MTTSAQNLSDLAPSISSAAQPARTRATNRILVTGLLTLDTVAVCVAFAFAYIVRFKSEWSIFYIHTTSQLDFYSTLIFLQVPAMLLIFAAYRLYNPHDIFDGANEYARIISAATLSMLLVVLVSFFFDGDLVVSRGWIIISWVSLILFVSLGRFSIRRLVYMLRARGTIGSKVGLVASAADADQLTERFAESPGTGLHIASILDPDAIMASSNASNRGQFERFLADQGIGDVIVSAASVPQSVLALIVRETAYSHINLHLIPGMYEIQTTGVSVREMRGLPLVTLNKVRITGFDYLLKRTMDYMVGSAALILLSPVLLTIALLIKSTSPGPIFHHRPVIGERGRRFQALKFRTMHVNGDEILRDRPDLQEELREHGKLADDPRVTSIGRFLRRSSLDEIPQLWNVLRGQMSLVGPRMITESELDHFGHWRENLVTVKPGLTGLWQVSGRSNLGYNDRVRLDMYYIRSYSIWQDIEILVRTVPAVVKGIGAY